jgi:hypothetical protein
MIKKPCLNEMLSFLHRVFTELEKIMPEIIPTSWKTHSEPELMDRCYSDITQRFPELKLCSAGWKAASLVTDWFPGWKRPQGNDETNDSVPAKRGGESSRGGSRKKIKKEPVALEPLPDPLCAFFPNL